ncbi:hypothetical protein RYZ20_03295 [Thioclava sp. A2]|uniref:phasin family protein n=1 Tax=Thioclava sp. FCG-A2 TaxID=3080562 RepID=UPI002954BA1D|nr:hypothetical protein [Thioclava sp. A2]MDV7269920.1 hypothetical protein [Thioclava sp. A2]
MAKTTTTATAAAEQAGLETLARMMRPQMAFASALIDYNLETLDFLRTRFERDKEMLGQIGKTLDPVQAASLWSEFWQRAASDYSVESSKLATALQSISQQAVRTMAEEGEALAGAVSPKA